MENYSLYVLCSIMSSKSTIYRFIIHYCLFAPSAACCVRNWCPELIFSFKIKTRTNARIFPNLRLDQKCILEKFFVILYAQNKDASDFPSTNNYLRNVRERKKCYFTLIYLTTENATRFCILQLGWTIVVIHLYIEISCYQFIADDGSILTEYVP